MFGQANFKTIYQTRFNFKYLGLHIVNTFKSTHKPVIFFDGHCGLCNYVVDFVIINDPNQSFYFAPLQGRTAKNVLGNSRPDLLMLDTIVVSTEKGFFTKSDAAFFVLSKLKGPIKFVLIFKFLPKFIRDLGYDFIAKHRYLFFAKKTECRLPTQSQKSLFLD